jgi:hypothetical protein
MALNWCGVLAVRKPDLFILVREIKPGLISGSNIFPSLVLNRTQELPEIY